MHVFSGDCIVLVRLVGGGKIEANGKEKSGGEEIYTYGLKSRGQKDLIFDPLRP